ncbi:hypothetical protein ACJX0J_032446, partial [Zea mays]
LQGGEYTLQPYVFSFFFKTCHGYNITNTQVKAVGLYRIDSQNKNGLYIKPFSNYQNRNNILKWLLEIDYNVKIFILTRFVGTWLTRMQLAIDTFPMQNPMLEHVVNSMLPMVMLRLAISINISKIMFHDFTRYN